MVTTEQHPDGRVKDRIDNYTKFWDKDPGQESDTHNHNRLGRYADVVNGLSFFVGPMFLCSPRYFFL